MRTSELIKILQTLPDKEVHTCDMINDFEYEIYRVVYNPNTDVIYIEGDEE